MRDHLGKGTDPTTGADTTPGVDTDTDTLAPKPKDQVIAELAPKLQKPGTTPGRAMLAAEQIYADAEKRFGPDAQTVLEQLQPGQDPRKFLDGFQNAYILGKQGTGKAALNGSGAAAYLTEGQRQNAYALGETGARTKGGMNVSENVLPTAPSQPPVGNNEDLLSVLKNGPIEERKGAFKKAFDEGMISTRISPQKQARHVFGTRQFLEYDAKLSARGDHPSYLRKDLKESELSRLVISKLQGKIMGAGNRTYEFVSCDEAIGYYYSKANGGYMETRCAQVIYAVREGNIHIVPVKQK